MQTSTNQALSKLKDFSAKSREAVETLSERAQLAKETYNSMLKLIEEAVQISKQEEIAPDDVENLESIVDAVNDMSDIVKRLISGESPTEGAVDMEEVWPEPKDPSEAARHFLMVYNKHKARLGLNTQEEVAKLTGLDRRYVSILENQKHKPQHKTLKKLADAFGIEVNEFLKG